YSTHHDLRTIPKLSAFKCLKVLNLKIKVISNISLYLENADQLTKYFESIAINCKQLKTLSIDIQMRTFDLNALISFNTKTKSSSKLNNLKHLKITSLFLSKIRYQNRDSIISILKSCKRLQTFDFVNYRIPLLLLGSISKRDSRKLFWQ